MTPDLLQSTVVGVVAAALVTGLFNLISRKSRTPETEAERTRLGNEFLRGLLEDARKEREELRTTITELKQTNETNEDAIGRLETLLANKTRRIEYLESRQQLLAEKLQHGEQITLADIFGADAPNVRITITDGAP
jgi:septal ring factor EnvC (AmiA/AmiB activator)